MRELGHGIRRGRAWLPGLVAVALLCPAVAAQRPRDDVYDVADLRRLQNTFARLAERSRPSVAAIRTYRTVPRSRRSREEIPVRVAENQGSGVITSADGYIVTNEHVVDGSDKIEVVLHNGEYYNGRLVQADRRSDLAVIKIDATGLTPASLGDVSRVRPGHWSFTIGNPFGLANEDGGTAFSVGNVTALGKSLSHQLDPTDTRYYGNLIQTTSPINPGNSGGPLFNVDGEVIGICTAMLSSSGANEGLGFAIPISPRTRQIISTLQSGERVRYGYMGVSISTPTRTRRAQAGVPFMGGAYVEGLVGRDGPAALAGLKTSDVIVEFDGVRIDDSDHFVRVVGATPVDSLVNVVYYRDGERRETRVRLAERPTGVVSARPPATPRLNTWRWRGVLLGEPTDTILSAHGLTRAEAGLVVIEAEAGPAHRAGLRERAVIMRYNGRRVRTIAEFQRIDHASSRRAEAVLELEDGTTLRIGK